MSNIVLKTIVERASVREFDKSRRVPDDLERKILLAGICAPSAGNIQPRTFIVVEDESAREQLYDLCENQAFMKDASLWIVVCADIHRHLRAAELLAFDTTTQVFSPSPSAFWTLHCHWRIW